MILAEATRHIAPIEKDGTGTFPPNQWTFFAKMGPGAGQAGVAAGDTVRIGETELEWDAEPGAWV